MEIIKLKRNWSKIVLFGIDKGKDRAIEMLINGPNEGSLHMAIARGDDSTAERLIDNRADVNEPTPRYGATPLFIASLKGNTRMVQKLLDHFADVDRATIQGETALHAATLGGE